MSDKQKCPTCGGWMHPVTFMSSTPSMPGSNVNRVDWLCFNGCGQAPREPLQETR